MITQMDVRVDRFEVRTFGRSAQDAVRILRELGYDVSDEAEEIILRMSLPTSDDTHPIAVVRSESFMDPSPTTELCRPADVDAYASSLGFTAMSVEDGWILREVISYRMLKKLGDGINIVVMHEPVKIKDKLYRLTIWEGTEFSHLGVVDVTLDAVDRHHYGRMWGFAYRA